MRYYSLKIAVLFCIYYLNLSYLNPLNAQPNLLKLSSEVLSAYLDLENSITDLQNMQTTIYDIKEEKIAKIPSGGWSDLATKYKDAAYKITNAPLPTEFDDKKYKISFEEMKNCKLKDQNLKKMKFYLQEIKNAKNEGEKSILVLDEIESKIITTRTTLRNCINLHEKLSYIPIFGQKFLFDWIILDQDVSKALSEFQQAVINQRKKITSEKNKLNIYSSNFEYNYLLIDKFLLDQCRYEEEIKNINSIDQNKALSTNNIETSVSPAITKKSGELVGNAFFIFITAKLFINGKSLTIISAPILYNGKLSDDMKSYKEEFIEKAEKQLINNPENFKKSLIKDCYETISVHYSKPYSTSLLKSENESLNAIAAFKQSIIDAIEGLPNAGLIDFFQLK